MSDAARVLAIRHGETTWNVDTRIQGQLDIDLNDTGRWQAQRLAQALAGEPISAIYASDLGRAYNTALAISRVAGIAVVTDTGLRERHFGEFQGKTFVEIETALPEQAIFGNSEKYRALFLRNADGSPYASLDLNDNLGEVKTDGVDISVNTRLGRLAGGAYGDFSVSVDGTWVRRYDYQNERGGPFVANVGRYADNGPVFRWKHTAALNWRMGRWSATLAQSYKSGYVDQNSVDAAYRHDVPSYSLFNLSGSYAVQGWLLTAGVKNLFDKATPFSNQGTLFQKGYDPRYTDPVGRAGYMRASYTF